MSFFSLPLVLNVIMYGLLLLVVFVGIKSADGFFAVGIMYGFLAFGGSVGPLAICIFNAVLYFLTKQSGFLMGIGFAIVVFIGYQIFAFLESRDFYAHHFAKKKISVFFQEATQLEPEKYIRLVLDGGKYGPTQIYLKEALSEEQLNSFSAQLQTVEDKKTFDLYVNNQFFQRIFKNA